MPLTVATVWRDFETDEVPASGPHKVVKREVRETLAAMESAVNAFLTNGGLVYLTRAAALADLAHDANQMAWVISDNTVAFNGIYQKSGASGTGTWTRVADLPYSFVRATDSGAGTANAIVATSTLPISDGTLVAFTVFEENTASPVTVAFNGATALTIKTAAGNNVSAGGLLAGSAILGFRQGSTLRLLTDQASAAIQAAAEAAAADAEASANAAETSKNEAAAIVGSGAYTQIGTGAVSRSNQTGFRERGITIPEFNTTHDGIVDDTVNFRKAFAAAAANGVRVICGAGKTYRLTDLVNITAPVRFENAVIIPDIGLTNQFLFRPETDDFHMRNVFIDGTGLAYNEATLNHHAIISGVSAPRKNHLYEDIRIKNWVWTGTSAAGMDDPAAVDGYAANLTVSYPIYLQSITHGEVKRIIIENCSGQGIVCKGCTDVTISRNHITNSDWSSINLESSCERITIEDNIVDSDGTGPNGDLGIWLGGAIQSMSQTSGGGLPNKKIRMFRNHVAAKISYGAAFRLESTQGLWVEGNTVQDWDVGEYALYASATSEVSAISIITRGTSTSDHNGPCTDVFVRDNVLKAPALTQNKHVGINCSNQWQSARNPMKNLHFTGNRFVSNSSTVGFGNAIVVHGQSGGGEGVWIHGNKALTRTRGGGGNLGAIAVLGSSAAGAVTNVYLGENDIENIQAAGSQGDSNHVAVNIGEYTDVVKFRPNTINNFHNGMTWSVLSGTDMRGQGRDTMSSIINRNYNNMPADRNLETATTAQLLLKTHSINVSGKYTGKPVYNTTVGAMVYAAGSTDVSLWVRGDDITISYLPAP